jgi:biotin carboxyl carrier protein
VVNVTDIKKLYEIFLEEDMDTVEIKNGEEKLRFTYDQRQKTSKGKSKEVKKGQEKSVAAASVGQSENQTEQGENQSNVYELRSKWIGFFTRLHPKTGESYMKLRDVVKKEDIVGHVRVLGVLQDVKSEMSGKVKEILIEEGQPIEYGQPIMRFEVKE